MNFENGLYFGVKTGKMKIKLGIFGEVFFNFTHFYFLSAEHCTNLSLVCIFHIQTKHKQYFGSMILKNKSGFWGKTVKNIIKIGYFGNDTLASSISIILCLSISRHIDILNIIPVFLL